MRSEKIKWYTVFHFLPFDMVLLQAMFLYDEGDMWLIWKLEEEFCIHSGQFQLQSLSKVNLEQRLYVQVAVDIDKKVH